jgi:uncharacterized protein
MSRAGALLLTHGAGGGPDHRELVAVEQAVAPLLCSRMSFPYRAAGRRAPDRAPVLLEAIRVAAAALVTSARVNPNRLVLGGRSMGGRMCSMAVADGLGARGLVLISYPLHPPGKPDQLRTAHFERLHVPCLFVSGRRDPFAAPDELEQATQAIGGQVELCWVDGARHELKGHETALGEMVADWIARLR